MCDRHTDVGKHVVNVGVHSFLRIISSLLSLSLSPSLYLSISLSPFPPNRLPDEPFARFVYIRLSLSYACNLTFPLFLFRIEARYRGYYGPERLFHTSARAGIRK